MREKALVVAAVLACTPNATQGSATSGGQTESTTTTGTATPTSTGTTAAATAATTATATTTATTAATAVTTTATDTDSDTDTPTTEDATSSGNVPGSILVIEGLGEFPVTCAIDDAHCGARTACELATNGPCEYVEYDCQLTGLGSYVPPAFFDTPENFSFALYAFMEDADYGNICSCMRNEAEGKAVLEGFGLATEHTWCGLGLWFLKG